MRYLMTCVLCSSLAACWQDLAVANPNRTPIAQARVLDREGSTVEVVAASGRARITLDGSGSYDPDGTFVSYRWLSGVPKRPLDAGMTGADSGPPPNFDSEPTELRWVPDGADEDWPDDTQRPQVDLPLGTFKFVLWVSDEHGRTSNPSALTINVVSQATPPAMP